MAAAGVNRRAAEIRLRQCHDAGLLTKPGRGWWAIPGGNDDSVPDVPATTPRPAMLRPTGPAVVITTTAPVDDAPTLDVVAASTTETTTATCTSTVSSLYVRPVDTECRSSSTKRSRQRVVQ
jgi:hypothetical protein